MSLFFPPLLLIIASFIADAVFDFSQFFNYGVAGMVLLWFIMKNEPRLKAIEESHHRESLAIQEALHKVSLSNLMVVMSNGVEPFKSQAESMKKIVDESLVRLLDERNKLESQKK